MLESSSGDPRAAYEKAVDLFGQGKLEEAAAAFQELIEAHPNHVDAYEAIGMVYYRMGRVDDAIEWTERLAAVDPSHAMAHSNLSVFYMKKGMKERAEEEKAKAVVLQFGKKK